MKLKKLIDHYLARKTRLVIKVIEPTLDGTDLKKVIGISAYAVSKEHPELMSCKVLQIDPAGAEIAVTITETKKQKSTWKVSSTFTDKE